MLVRDDQSWHFDKRIPIALIFAIIIQGAVGLTWANNITFDMNYVKEEIKAIKQQTATNNGAVTEVSLIKRDLEHISKGMSRLEDTMNLLVRERIEREILNGKTDKTSRDVMR